MDHLSKRERRARAQRARAKRRARKRQSALHALTTSALALPGVATPALAETEYGITADYNFAKYTEDKIPTSKLATGSEGDRYEIDIHQLHLGLPVTERLDLAFELAYETMTGASPWYVRPDDTTGEPVQVMTGATIEDQRTDILASGNYAMDWGKYSGSGGVSIERDYMAFNLGGSAEREFNEKNTTLSGGLGASYDLIEPTDGGTAGRVKNEDKHSVTLFGSLSQVLGATSAIQSTMTYQYAGGFLSDPYKRALVAGITRPDARPDQRHQFSLLTRYRKHFERVGASLHLDYRYYIDDWDVNAHTFDLAWYQNFFGIMRLTPSIRYYTQSQSNFYAPFYLSETSNGLYSSDYRLSPYGALSYRIRAETRFQTWNLDWSTNISYEHYESSADLAIQSVGLENPGLVSFDMWSVGFTTRF